MNTQSVQTVKKAPRYIAIQHDSLQDILQQIMLPFDARIRTREFNKSHTKAAQKVGGGSRYWYDILPSQKYEILPGDFVQPMLRLRDQTFPGAALTLEVGLYRLVCTNGLMAFSREELIRIPHTPNKEELLKGIAAALQQAMLRVQSIILEAQRVARLPVLDVQALLSKLDLTPMLRKYVERRLAAKQVRPEDNLNTVWGLYNFVNEVDAGTSRSPVAAARRDSRMLSQIIQLNSAA